MQVDLIGQKPADGPSQTIRAVIFDIGGVLVRIKDTTVYRDWEVRLGLPEGELTEIIFTHPVAQRAVVGDATPEDLWSAVGAQLGLSMADLQALQADFWRPGVWDTGLLAFIRSLRPQFRTATISDAWLDAREMVSTYVNKQVFDVSVFSAEEGVRKPDPEIYKRALSRLGVTPQEAIFVDDRLKNVQGARQVGMQAIHFTDSDRVCCEILRLIETHQGPTGSAIEDMTSRPRTD